MSGLDEFVEVECDVVVATGSAVLVRTADDEEVWVPRSLLQDEGEEIFAGACELDAQTLYVREWFAAKEGLI